MPAGDPVTRHRIEGGGLTAWILSYGAVLQDLRFEGHPHPLVLGFERFEPYLTSSPYFGAIAGRCANRITNASFEIDGKTFQLDRNVEGIHSLHGGSKGMGKRNWDVVGIGPDSVTLEYIADNGEMGYPGKLSARVTYTCLPDGIFDIRLHATTDTPTLCNLAHHTYWALDDTGDTAHHLLQVDADHYVEVDDLFIPTGTVANVAGTRFDFRTTRPIADETLIDHNLCLSSEREPLRRVARLMSTQSDVSMEVLTTEPGLQVYDGYKIDIDIPGLEQKHYGPNAGLALEPQVWPDAINHDSFPNAVLRPDDTYRQHTQFKFSKGPAS